MGIQQQIRYRSTRHRTDNRINISETLFIPRFFGVPGKWNPEIDPRLLGDILSLGNTYATFAINSSFDAITYPRRARIYECMNHKIL